MENLKEILHHKKTFDKVCFEFYENNVWQCFESLFFHCTLSFIQTWRFGHNSLIDQFCKQKVLVSSLLETGIRKETIFLYRNLFTQNLMFEKNQHNHMDFWQILNDTFQFVTENFYEIALIQSAQNKLIDLPQIKKRNEKLQEFLANV